jgi:hypothetical protein
MTPHRSFCMASSPARIGEKGDHRAGLEGLAWRKANSQKATIEGRGYIHSRLLALDLDEEFAGLHPIALFLEPCLVFNILFV